ncbi:Stemmadenine O-acetyltransferase [Sesamum alatum]|uniref:Stemmadenine O-acetyltransferase n=1 Tax=Sesamum alatum TaxID=300844 RepID=A0AAE2CPB4_9LAMI|nr:Stemmadenine O-acetyltransferase [Sesamum alatum]
MIMDVEIISVERIKPSFPTPNHLRNFKLCLLDHLIPAAYAPVVVYYPNDGAASHCEVLERLAVLKKSLSETLTRFFPLAGTIRDDVSIDCDDHGACFTTAKVKCTLSEFLESPDLKMIALLLPCGLDSGGDCVTNIQASEFACGGVSVGLCISHRILDGTALSTFLKSWANAASSSVEKLVSPDFSASSLFPADLWLKDASIAMWGSLFKKGQFVTRRFMFNGSAIASLKDMATGTSKPTRVEAVSGFIWKCAMAASEERSGCKRPSLLTHIVNLRKRAAPNFSEQSLGNLIWMTSAKFTAEKQNLEFPDLVDEIRRSISNIDGEYVKKLRGGDGPNTIQKYLKEIVEFSSKDVEYFGFTSWCKLGFYEVDFGWGKPVWVSSIDSSGPFYINLSVLMDSRCGDGIEAWVTLDEQEMAILQGNQEFTRFASFNPSPLHAAECSRM